MARVKTDFSLARTLKINENDALNIGGTTEKAMKKSIASGLSPVRGVGRFKRYSEQIGSKPSNYPKDVRGRYPTKKTRPVNLYLNGWYLSHLTHWFNKRSNTVGVGFSGSYEKKTKPPKAVIDYFEAHNEGMHPHVPKRKHLPNKKGDQFTKTIQSAYKKEFERAVARAIKKMNKKK